jgi:hypothetical protein
VTSALRQILACALVILLAAALRAQSPAAQSPDVPRADGSVAGAGASDSWFTRVSVSPSRVVAASPFESAGDGAQALSIEVGRQTAGGAGWHRVYNYPAYGVGVYTARFDHRRELGQPIALYGFFSWPFPVAARAQLSADVGLGVAWRWHAYDAATNPTNTALGSSAAYHVNGAVLLHFLASERASLYGGLSVTHWSNGATRQPNLGLAIVGPQAGIRYDFAPRAVHRRARSDELPPFAPAWEFLAGAAGSSKNVVAAGSGTVEGGDRRRSFGALNASTALQRHFYRFGSVGSGLDVTYDGAAGARVDLVNGREVESRAPASRRMSLGVYGGYEHLLARLSLLFDIGYTAFSGIDNADVPRLYERYGARFRLSDHFWTTFAVRTVKGRKANFMELGLGYRFRFAASG